MSIVSTILGIFIWILLLPGIVGAIGLLPSVIVGIISLIKSSKEQDFRKKAAIKKRGFVFIIVPFALIFASTVLVMVLKAIGALLKISLN